MDDFLMQERLQEILPYLETYATMHSCCKRRQVGAVVIYDNHILAWGANRRIDHTACTSCVREEKQIPSGAHSEFCYALHAEMDALIKASKCNVDLSKCTLICTTQPCSHCLKSIAAYGISTVYYHEPYQDALNEELSKQIKCILF